MNGLQQNESISRLIIWWNYLPQLSKSYKGKDCLFLFKEGWSLLIRRLSIKVTLESLLLAVSIEKSSKSCVWLQNKRCSLMAESSSSLTLFPVSAEIPNIHGISVIKVQYGFDGLTFYLYQLTRSLHNDLDIAVSLI